MSLVHGITQQKGVGQLLPRVSLMFNVGDGRDIGMDTSSRRLRSIAPMRTSSGLRSIAQKLEAWPFIDN